MLAQIHCRHVHHNGNAPTLQKKIQTLVLLSSCTRADPAVLEQAMKMMQNPMVMQQMKVMMQDPAVKERMKRMLAKLGENSAVPGADKG